MCKDDNRKVGCVTLTLKEKDKKRGSMSEATQTKRQLLLETGKTLFFKHGLKRVTVEEICESAGISKVTFYKYFRDKKQLAEEIRDTLVETGFSKFDEISARDIRYPEKVDLMTQWRIGFFAPMSSEFIEEVLSLEDLQEQVKKRYLANIASAQEKGEIRQDLSPELIWLVSEKLTEIIKEGSWKRIFPDYGDFQKQLRNMYFNGLLEREGSELPT